MTDLRGWSLPEQHLLPDVVVAFVDGELSAVAHDRASAHLARCRYCAAEANHQRQVRSAVRSAAAPATPAGLLASLRAIPQQAELPPGPDNLAITADGQLVSVLRPGAFGAGPAFGSGQPLGQGSAVLGQTRRSGRRNRHSASVVVSGLVLGALALVTPHGTTYLGGGEPVPGSTTEGVVAPAGGSGPTSTRGRHTAPAPVAITTTVAYSPELAELAAAS